VRSLPYYLNPSFLVVRDDLWEFLRRSDDHRFAWVRTERGPASWLQLLEAAEAFRPKGADVPLFDCPLETRENLNCLFLEILASVLGGAAAVNALDFYSCFDAASPINKDTRSGLVAATQVLRAVLRETYLSHVRLTAPFESCRKADADGAEEGTDIDLSTPLKVNGRALFQRHWYSTCREMALVNGDGCAWKHAGYTLLNLPGGVWTCGDWHLGILAGSVGVRSGVRMLFDEFLTPEAAVMRLIQGVGLPPQKSFYDPPPNEGLPGGLPILGVPLSWFRPYVEGADVIRRSAIHGYQQVSPILHGFLHSILANDGDEAWIRGQFLTMHAMLTKLPRS
jgi:hypothetical protein